MEESRRVSESITGQGTAPRKLPRQTPTMAFCPGNAVWPQTRSAKVHRFFKQVIGRLQMLAGRVYSPQPNCISCIRSDWISGHTKPVKPRRKRRLP